MSVPVYLAKLAVKNPSDHRLAKIKRLCDAVGLADKVKPLGTVGEDEVVAIKRTSAKRATIPTCTRRSCGRSWIA